MDERLERHLCNLHNEVFEAAESRINTECSITIREGISDAVINAFNQGEFPHYTWGYIGRTEQSAGDCEVPSLYVRVYRTGTPRMPSCSRSLTASEGISELRIRKSPSTSFPHCKWGYIGLLSVVKPAPGVPSLQVRVYRYVYLDLVACHSSLTASEGISTSGIGKGYCSQFPHCKWGYIGDFFNHKNNMLVPSLQVRVYRPAQVVSHLRCGSLTASEGISVKPFIP